MEAGRFLHLRQALINWCWMVFEPILFCTPEIWVQSRRLRSLCGVAGEPAIVTRLGFGLNSQLHWYRPIIVQLTVGLQLYHLRTSGL